MKNRIDGKTRLQRPLSALYYCPDCGYTPGNNCISSIGLALLVNPSGESHYTVCRACGFIKLHAGDELATIMLEGTNTREIYEPTTDTRLFEDSKFFY